MLPEFSITGVLGQSLCPDISYSAAEQLQPFYKAMAVRTDLAKHMHGKSGADMWHTKSKAKNCKLIVILQGQCKAVFNFLPQTRLKLSDGWYY